MQCFGELLSSRPNEDLEDSVSAECGARCRVVVCWLQFSIRWVFFRLTLRSWTCSGLLLFCLVRHLYQTNHMKTVWQMLDLWFTSITSPSHRCNALSSEWHCTKMAALEADCSHVYVSEVHSGSMFPAFSARSSSNDSIHLLFKNHPFFWRETVWESCVSLCVSTQHSTESEPSRRRNVGKDRAGAEISGSL